MKIHLLSLLTLSTLVSASAFGMGGALPQVKDESVYNSKIVANFNLHATDGSVLKFSSSQSRAINISKSLPAERNADYSKCDSSNKVDVDLFLKVSDISIQLIQQKRALTSAEVALIQKTPRCSPFLASLNLIAIALSPEESAEAKGEEIKSLTLQVNKKSGNYLLVNTQNQKSAAFKISSDLKGLKVKELRDFTKVQILASQSGQNAGIRFRIENISDSEPSHSRDFESCQYTRTERQCRYDRESRENKCEYVTITGSGERSVRSVSNSTTYNLRIDIVDTSNRVLATGVLYDSEFNTDKEYGSCMPTGGGRGHNRRDF